MDEDARGRLQHIHWIGGGSGAGKSTIARRIAAEHGLDVYATDDVMGDHARRSNSADAPQLADFAGMSHDERWVTRSPQEMLDTFHWFRGEGFGLIVDDLLAMRTNSPVVVEGFRLLPHLVAPLLTDRRQAVWLLPTPEFRRAAFARRTGEADIPGRTSDPARALENLLERDRMFTERLRGETAELGLTALEVNGSISEDALTERVYGLSRF